ncbi:hypothetical protein ILUMI_09309 [Ignelater luminosus]|uniref:Uncharacterized protein n=1 Tax=Ignelater luminosus TaxID=2038154 RepID=A0A8K0G9S9_IGNLU|nr:hypothetical protein ILUMI_09309 [Ignelater luminosus]
MELKVDPNVDVALMLVPEFVDVVVERCESADGKVEGNCVNKMEIVLYHDNKIINKSKELARVFVKHYSSSVQEKLKNHFGNSTCNCTTMPTNNSSLYFYPVTITEIKDVVNAIQNKPSTGIDKMPISLIKECLEEFAMCFLPLINKSMELGQFPSRLKTALIVSVFKKGEEQTKQKERKRYHKRKAEGKIKLIDELSERKKRIMRRRWKQSSQNYRWKQKINERENRFLTKFTPVGTPTSVCDLNDDNVLKLANTPPLGRSLAGRKRVLRKRSATVKKLKKVKEELANNGPSTQYRNKSMFQLIGTELANILRTEEISWNYFEGRHGKGAVDGVGSCLKRTADRLVACGLGNFEILRSSVEKLNYSNVYSDSDAENENCRTEKNNTFIIDLEDCHKQDFIAVE